MKKLLAVVALISASSAQAALNTGDLAFTAFNGDEDGWALTTFVDIAPNSNIYFTDKEWDGAAFTSGEQYASWNTGASLISAGNVIRFSAVDTTSPNTTIGTFTQIGGKMGLSAKNETIYAYLGTDEANPTTFLAAISNASDITGSKGGLTNTGLVKGVSAIELTSSTDFGEYTGVRAGKANFAEYKALVGNVANWNMVVGGSQASQVPNTTAFTVAAVPEPQTYAMLLAGLSVMGASARRKLK